MAVNPRETGSDRQLMSYLATAAFCSWIQGQATSGQYGKKKKHFILA